MVATILVRRVEEHRFWKSKGPGESEEYLFELVRDADDEVAAEAMELVIARSRRFDRFQEPIVGGVEFALHRVVKAKKKSHATSFCRVGKEIDEGGVREAGESA